MISTSPLSSLSPRLGLEIGVCSGLAGLALYKGTAQSLATCCFRGRARDSFYQRGSTSTYRRRGQGRSHSPSRRCRNRSLDLVYEPSHAVYSSARSSQDHRVWRHIEAEAEKRSGSIARQPYADSYTSSTVESRYPLLLSAAALLRRHWLLLILAAIGAAATSLLSVRRLAVTGSILCHHMRTTTSCRL